VLAVGQQEFNMSTLCTVNTITGLLVVLALRLLHSALLASAVRQHALQLIIVFDLLTIRFFATTYSRVNLRVI